MASRRQIFQGLRFGGLLCAVLAFGSAPAERVSVDFGATVGPVKPVNGVGQPPMVGKLRGWDMMHYLKEANVPYSRLHDVGGWMGGGLFVDIPNLFPDFDADEDDPKSYRFAYTDNIVDALVKNGVEPFFRLGVSIENFVEWGLPPVRTVPPTDFAKWARVCEHVIRHYTEGWADGRTYKIAYWEIWNEPDCLPDAEQNPMWHAPFADYVRFYGVVAPYLKGKFPQLKIGGYGSCGFYAGTGAQHVAAANSSPRHAHFIACARTFLAAARDNRWPLDFFSYHSYSSSTQALLQVAFADGLLNEFGFTRVRTERVFDEWMPAEGLDKLGTAMHAAHIAAEVIGLQNGPCDLACIYDARCADGRYAPLFDPVTHGPRKAYYAFKAFGELRRLGTSVRPPATPENVFAAAATDGKGRAAVLIANVSGKTWNPEFDFGRFSVVSARVVDETRDYAEAAWPAAIGHETVWLLSLKGE